MPVIRAQGDEDFSSTAGYQGSRQEEVNRPVWRGSSERPGGAVVPGARALWRLAHAAVCVRQQSQLACTGRQAGTDVGP